MEFNSRRSNVRAKNGMVATSQPLAAMAGLRILMSGGNAIDAAVATAATLSVVEPQSTSVGGDVFSLIWMNDEKTVRALNASGRSSGSASRSELLSQNMSHIPVQSPYAVTVPGAVSGWATVLERYGTMDLSDVLKPAIEYASNGYPVSELVSTSWKANAYKLQAFPSGGELLLNGKAPATGQVMRMPELAKTLQIIAEGGSEAFYQGDIAKKIVGYVQERGGWITLEDMKNHEANWVEPISTEYRGVTCWQCPPNGQGINVLMALNIAQGFDLQAMGFQSAETYHHLIESMRLSLADGLWYVTDPEVREVPVSELNSYKYADKRRQLIKAETALDDLPVGVINNHSDTVYISCVDGDGNACSFINSIFSGFGTGLVVPDTGIVLQNRGSSFSLSSDHPNVLEPNKRPFHTLIPGMATVDDKLWLSYGVMGGMQQAQGHFQALINMIDFKLSPQEALNAPRFSVRPGEGIAIEPFVSEKVTRDLINKGHNIIVDEANGVFFGGGQIISRDGHTGILVGGSEPRLDGCAVGW